MFLIQGPCTFSGKSTPSLWLAAASAIRATGLSCNAWPYAVPGAAVADIEVTAGTTLTNYSFRLRAQGR